MNVPGPDERGFTLVELLVVVLVLGILGALTVPGFRTGLARHQLDTTARMLAADIREVQELTLNEESPTQEFYIMFYEHSYHILKNDRILKNVDLPPGITLTLVTFIGQKQVWFSNGSVSPKGSGGTVRFRQQQLGLWSDVVVKPVTGRVRIENSWEVPDAR